MDSINKENILDIFKVLTFKSVSFLKSWKALFFNFVHLKQMLNAKLAN
jgi:hypothetical protein